MIIIFNEKMSRYEVFGDRSVVRNGEIQPLFVSADSKDATSYIKRVWEEGR